MLHPIINLQAAIKPIPSRAGPAGTDGKRHGRAGKKRSASPALHQAVVEHLRPVEDAGAPVPGGPLAGSAFFFCDHGMVGKATLERLVARLGGTVGPYTMYIFYNPVLKMRLLHRTGRFDTPSNGSGTKLVYRLKFMPST